MKLYSYVVARDYGFAPNPFHGYCTLVTCKPFIRRTAGVGDWIIGTGSAAKGRSGRIVYAMKVEETLSFDAYWHDARFEVKRPNLSGSLKQAYGDNIYHAAPDGTWCQENSHHSLENGNPNYDNVANDTQAPRALISRDFVYWGGNGPVIPTDLRNFDGYDLCAGRAYKNRFTEAFIVKFETWLRSLGESGYCGEPLDWPHTI